MTLNPLRRFPGLNNRWMALKHRIRHFRERRDRAFDWDVSINRPRNVLVVVVDCLRADHVSGFGYERETTPALDAFAETARSFPNAKAPSPWTFPSIPSLLSGRYPHEHGGRMTGDPRDLSTAEFPTRPRADVPMLPDLLANAGYDTAMFTAIPMASKAAGDRFQHVSVGYEPAFERVSTASEWLADRDRWFCHVQLGDPHAPLDVPDDHRETFSVEDVDGLEDWRFRESTDGDGFDSYRENRLRAYDAAIRGCDDALASLLDAVADDTVVVVCGDHGEAFWEHIDLERRLNDDPRGYYGTDHGHSVLEEVARVPLWVRAPDLEPSVDADPASLTAVAPAVLRALGASAREAVDAASIADVRNQRPALCEETGYGYNQRAVWLDDRKLVDVPATGTRLAFDVADGSEGDPLADVSEPLVDALDEYGDGVASADTIDVDADTRDRLEELGYLE